MAQGTTVNVKDAVRAAQAYLTELFPVHGEMELEEVELLPGDSGWHITFSYDRSEIRGGLMLPRARVYKTVTLDAEGTPRSIKNALVNAEAR
jgi:hypothetical protein